MAKRLCTNTPVHPHCQHSVSVAYAPRCQTDLGTAGSSASDCSAHDKLSTIRSLFPASYQAEKVIHPQFIVLWRHSKLLAKHFHHI